MYGLGFFINCDDLNFGTEQNPQCGICNRPYFRHHSICDYCDDSWCLDEDKGRYEHNESHQISHDVALSRIEIPRGLWRE